jgi:DNA repair exonuclease SbcCD ATPase subunit
MDEKELIDLGLSKELAQKISSAFLKESEKNNSENLSFKKQISERESQITELKKFKGSHEDLQKKIEELENENKVKSAEFEKALLIERKNNAIRSSLISDPLGKPHDVDLVIGMVDTEKVSVDQNGKIVGGFKEQLDTIKKEKAFLFQKAENFSPSGKPPANGGNPNHDEDDGKSKTAIGELFLEEWEKERGIKK